MFRKLVSGDGQRSAYHPENARSILPLIERLATGWALGGHPETGAHPGADWTRIREAGPLWTGDGLVGEKTLFACGTGRAGDGVACPEEYSGLAAASVTPWSCTPGIPDGIWKVSATANPRRRINDRRPRALRTTGRPWRSMIDSRNIQMVDAAAESQPGRSMDDTRPRFRPNGALSCPHICPWRRVPR